MDRLAIRTQITASGFKLYSSLPEHLKYIAGEFMALNEDYVLNHQNENETISANTILKCGFTINQEVLLQQALEHYKR